MRNNYSSDVSDVVFAVLYLLAVFGFLFGIVKLSNNLDERIEIKKNKELSKSAEVWIDISSARNCYDIQGVEQGLLVIGCEDGRTYKVEHMVYELADTIRKKETK